MEENNLEQVKEEKSLVMELLKEMKNQSLRWFRAFIAMAIIEVVTIVIFIWYLNQYDFSSSVEQTGVYTFSDSEGNVISSDITPEQMKEILEVINGKDKSDQKKD